MVVSMKKFESIRLWTGAAAMLFLVAACTPTVRLQAPEKPIEINLNINIKHEILIKVEKEVEEMFEEEDLF